MCEIDCICICICVCVCVCVDVPLSKPWVECLHVLVTESLHTGIHTRKHSHIYTRKHSHNSLSLFFSPSYLLYVQWLIQVRVWLVCDMAIHSCVCHDSFMCVSWLNHVCAMTNHDVHVCHDAFICAPWLLHTCTMTQWYLFHDSCICAMTHSHTVICVTTHTYTLISNAHKHHTNKQGHQI